MAGWLNWHEIERNNDWGVRSRNDATAALWNDAAEQWEKRAQREEDFSRRQIEALKLSPNDTVLDICCGTGPLTVWLAQRVKSVTAFDYGEAMLDYVRRKAEQRGLDNVACIQGNWYSMEPGVDFPQADIAVTRHSPAQGDILKFSRCARKYCYSLWNCAPYSQPGQAARHTGRWIRSDKEENNFGPRPDGRLYGYNVHFNLLYDMGANPTLRYVTDTTEYIRDSREELYAAVTNGRTPEPELAELLDSRITQLEDGRLRYRMVSKISILGWDPGELQDL